MANQYNNKVTLQNGTTLIDLTTDTVTDASHIMSGHRGHLADGSVVDGTGASESQVVSIRDVPNSTGITAEITGVPAPEGSIEISQNGTVDVTDYEEAIVNVDVSGGGGGASFEPSLDGKNHYKFLVVDNSGTEIAVFFTRITNVDWGDGTTTANALGATTHIYSTPGIYDVSFDGIAGTWNNSNIAARYRGELISAEVIGNSGTGQLREAYGLYNAYFVDGSLSDNSRTFQLCYDCHALVKCHLPNSLTELGQNAFYQCYSLKIVNIPTGLTSIGASCFEKCRSLTSITLPATLTNISNYAFRYCTNLTEYHFESATPPTLGSSAFYTSTALKIYVPKGSLEAYQTATNWSTYASYMVEEE